MEKFKCGLCGKEHDIRSKDYPIMIQFGREALPFYINVGKRCVNKLYKTIKKNWESHISEEEFESD